MSYTAFGVPQTTAGVGTTPLAVRQILSATFSGEGIISGGTVTGRSDLYYNVTAVTAAINRSAAYGTVLATADAGTVLTTAGTAGKKRYDAICLQARDVTQGDADNLTQIIVVSGGDDTTSPSLPAIPANAIALDIRLVPAGMSQTSQTVSTGSINYVPMYASGLGKIAENINTMDGIGDGTAQVYYEQQVSFTVNTDRILRLKFDASVGTQGQTNDSRGAWFMCFQIDGVDIPQSGVEFSLDRTFSIHSHEVEVVVPKGTHTARIRDHWVWGDAPWWHYTGAANDQYIGRIFRVYDEGIAR